MGISATEAARIHRLAQAAGIPDQIVDEWSGGDTTITEERASGLKAAVARQVEQRIKDHTAPATSAPPTPGPDAATSRQVEYIASLLSTVIRTGSGPYDSHPLVRRRGSGPYVAYEPDVEAIRTLTRQQASTTINVLKESYL